MLWQFTKTSSYRFGFDILFIRLYMCHGLYIVHTCCLAGCESLESGTFEIVQIGFHLFAKHQYGYVLCTRETNLLHKLQFLHLIHITQCVRFISTCTAYLFIIRISHQLTPFGLKLSCYVILCTIDNTRSNKCCIHPASIAR